MADDFQSGICSGSWWNPARSFEMAEVNARSGDEPAGSASGSSITFQDTHKVIPQDQMMGGQLMDSSLQIPTFGLSATTMDWTQALLSSGRAETNYQALLEEDLSSKPFLRQDQSMNRSLLLAQPHLISGNIDNFVSAPAPMMDYCENLNELPQDSWQKIPQFLKASTPNQQPTTYQLQFANNTPFWNPWAATACEIRSGFYRQATTKFGAHTFEQKPSCRSLTLKSNSVEAREQTKKSNSNESALKKPRIETPSPLPTFKVRKEKLGDRITALQQLVSPFGKTDTASVLHEAIEYIKFLHDQVSVLSTPYLKNGHPMQHQENSDKSMDGEGPKQDLRSRGLCLVPVASTYQVASEPQADFWTPTFGGTYR